MTDDTERNASLISIVVPVYNHERYVRAAIDSLLAQSYPELELILVNDGSTDGTGRVLDDLAVACQKRFRRYRRIDQENRGVASALNQGIAAAEGEFVYLLASDDIAMPSAIADLSQRMRSSPDIGVACADASFIGEDGNPLPQSRDGQDFPSLVRYYTFGREDVSLGDAFGTYASLLGGNYISPGILLRRKRLVEVGLYDPGLKLEDWAMWLKLAKVCRFSFVDRPLCGYRVHSSSTMRTQLPSLYEDVVRILMREAEYAVAQGLAELWRKQAEASLIACLALKDRKNEEALAALTATVVELRAELEQGHRALGPAARQTGIPELRRRARRIGKRLFRPLRRWFRV